METGADATLFIQQYASFGLKGKFPLLCAMNTTDQSVIRTLGEECEGIVSAAHFAEGSTVPVTAKFVEAYTAKFQRFPSLYGFAMFSCAMWVTEAIKNMGGKIDDRSAFIDTVLKTDLKGSPLGTTVKLDAYGNPVYDVYIRNVMKRPDGKFWNVPTETYPGVSQFWKYVVDTYLELVLFPSLSRYQEDLGDARRLEVVRSSNESRYQLKFNPGRSERVQRDQE